MGPSQASIICLSSPNLPRSVSLRADQPVLVVHVVGQVRLLLRAMRGGLAFLRVDLPALVPLSLTGIRRSGMVSDASQGRAARHGESCSVRPNEGQAAGIEVGQHRPQEASEGVPDRSPVEPDCGVDPKRPQEPSSAGRGPQKEASRSSPGGGRQKAASRWVNYERAMEGPASGERE